MRAAPMLVVTFAIEIYTTDYPNTITVHLNGTFPLGTVIEASIELTIGGFFLSPRDIVRASTTYQGRVFGAVAVRAQHDLITQSKTTTFYFQQTPLAPMTPPASGGVLN